MKKILVLLMASTLFFASSAFAMTVTDMDSAENMAAALGGSGVTISNVNYTGATGAAGYFSGGNAAGIEIDEGIVLTTGDLDVLGAASNTEDGSGQNLGLGGNATLGTLIPGYTTYDASILSFDFVSDGDAAYFNYIFGSEEYNEYVGSSYNDVFGFFVDGVNYAQIPGTSIPVSINNVNNGSYSEFFNDNDPTNGIPTPYSLAYDGFTTMFTASITGLTAGETYSIMLGIADAGDHILDSGVFLEAGSFSDITTVPEPATMLLFGLGLLGLAGVNRKK